VLRILASTVVRERSAEAFEAILEACRVVDRGRDEREVLVAHGKERSCELEGGGVVIGSDGACCDAVEGPIGKHERDTIQHEAEKTPVVVVAINSEEDQPVNEI
jgi:hypothetical protein